MRIRRVDIKNFRGIKSASWVLPVEQQLFVLIGPGDSTKTTVLTAIQYALYDRWTLNITDADFYEANVDEPINIRVALVELPGELLSMDSFGNFLSGIDAAGEWRHDPDDDDDVCIIIELVVESDLEPRWRAYRPVSAGNDELQGDDPPTIRMRDRKRMTTYRIDDRIDAQLRWSRTSALGKLTTNDEDTRATLTAASRAAADSVASTASGLLGELAREVQTHVQTIGTTRLTDLKPGLDMSLAGARGNLALFDGAVPLTNFGLGTRRLAGVAIQRLAHENSPFLLVDEVEHGLEPHRLVHLLTHLQEGTGFSQVFVTTHSPTALAYLEAATLVMVRSSDGSTQLRSLAEPSELQKLLRSSPEAFLARRVVVNEGKTECGVVIEHLAAWDRDQRLPAAALGVVPVAGGGGSQSVGWAKQLCQVGYDVVLFMDSDDETANRQATEAQQLGVILVQWPGSNSIETAVTAQLDMCSLSAFIGAAIKADDRGVAAARLSMEQNLKNVGALTSADGFELVNVETWGIELDEARTIIATTAQEKDWFKRVGRGRHLGQYILRTKALQNGDVQETFEKLKNAVYALPSDISASDDGPARA